MGYHILVADDEENIRKLIRKYAEFEGHDVTEASDGMQACELCARRDFDIAVMDIMMPQLDGLSAARRIRGVRDMPIIILSARGEEYDRISGFEAGVDDYVVKPFSPKELMLRIDAVMKRASRLPKSADVVTIGTLRADISARRITIDGAEVAMSPKEYELFFYMLKNRGIALTREKLICEVWGYDFYGDDRTLDTHIKLLRKSLGAYSDLIVTLRGVGYRFEAR